MSRKLTTVLCACVLIGAASARAELHSLGFVQEDLSKVAPKHEVKSVPVAPGAASFRDMPRVDLTGEMPPAGDQGGQGSCASWAITYYHRTQLEYHERHWDLTDRNHQFSPAFTYNQVNGGGDNGSGFDNNMALICESGVASLADCPYSDRDCVSWPSESAYSRAIPFRTREWGWFRTTDTTGVNKIRQLLANGSTSCLAIRVYGNFDGIAGHDYMYCVADKEGSNRGGHLVTFVGYDDTLTTHDGQGAFRMVNSWGPGWGQQGYFWMSYEAVMDHDLSQGSAGFLTDTVGYVPKLLARVRLDHPTRDRVAIEFSVGRRWSSLWMRDFRSFRDARTDQPFPANKMVFDLTDAESFITGGQTDSIYFCTWDCRADGQTGSVLTASVQHLDWGTILASGSTPVAIPDNGDAVAAGLRIWKLDRDVSATAVLWPLGILEPDSSYTPQVEVRNYGIADATFPVLLTISSGYADTVQVSGLEPAHAETLQFSPWVVPARCTAVVRCQTALAGDEYSENDTVSAVAWARYRDVGLTEILAPADTVDSGSIVRPQVHVLNNGTQSEFITATFKIPDEGYLRSSRVTVQPHETLSISFAAWTPKLTGSHAFRCSLSLAGDMDASNDTMSGIVLVQPVGIAEGKSVTPDFRLDVPKPSVVRGNVTIKYALPRAAATEMSIYDATGTMVRRLVRGTSSAGVHAVTWDGSDDAGRAASAGAYFCRLEADGRRTTAVLLKL
jgi:hypothetical protein